MSDMEKAIDDRTKLVSLNQTMCWCGFTYDMRAVSDIAHEHGAYARAIKGFGKFD